MNTFSPNWSLFQRESQLYADVAAFEDGLPIWSKPSVQAAHRRRFKPLALELAESLSRVGACSSQGVRAVSEVWSALEFKNTEHAQDAIKLTQTLLERLIDEKLPTQEASQRDVNMLYDWQMPMYNLDFKLINVPLADLVRDRDAVQWAQADDSRSG